MISVEEVTGTNTAEDVLAEPRCVVEQRARSRISELEPPRRATAACNLHNAFGDGMVGFFAVQAYLDQSYDLGALGLVAHDARFARPPIELLGFAELHERPLTRQEAVLLNEYRPRVIVEGPILARAWPLVRGGDLPTELQAEFLPKIWAADRQSHTEAA